jgi:hypothetical protein
MRAVLLAVVHVIDGRLVSALQRVAVHGSVPMQLLWQPSLVAGGAQSEQPSLLRRNESTLAAMVVVCVFLGGTRALHC